MTALKNDLGEVFPVQRVEGKCCAFVCNLRPMGMTPLYFAEMPAEDSGMWADGKGFETPIFKGRFDPAMRIESLYDKRAGRMVNKPGQALGRMVCYENKPHNYDAWDINIYYNQRHSEVDGLISSELVSTGPVPVSYTHLDVYNRQGHENSPRFRAARRTGSSPPDKRRR